MMLISQFGKIIRIDTKTIRSAGRSTSGVKLLNLDTDDKVAAAVGHPPRGCEDAAGEWDVVGMLRFGPFLNGHCVMGQICVMSS